MTEGPTPKKPHEKDAQYMRQAYLYTAILLILGLIGGLMLAERIVTAEQNRQINTAGQDTVEQQEEPRPGDPSPSPRTPAPE